ncbi:hypothetical protein KY333_02115 [Candidatus Woesearchaeota archaeon]|nr:hypothetical protein [Candidatus Woesearchaeota archaeon]MBW2994114.1 hypothetical protein [Candidatus Woesearchaeota archaeon]
MVVKETRIIKYELENPDFAGVEFTEHSDKWLTWPDAVRFAAEQGDGAILQSSREAAAFRIEAKGKHDADKYQSTRNVALYFKVGDKFYCAIDDIADSEQNIVIARAQEGYNSHSNNDKYLLPVTDSLVKGALSRAEKTGRIVEVIESPLELKTKEVKKKSEFGQHDWNKAILLDMAEPYAKMLNTRNYEIGRVWSLTPENLEEIGVDGNSVEVRPVGLGDIPCSSIYVVIADNRFTYNGRSCGVRGAKNFSTGNKGRLVKLDKRLYANVRKMLA